MTLSLPIPPKRQTLPRAIDFSTEVPRTETDKMAKRRLREKYWAGKSSRIV